MKTQTLQPIATQTYGLEMHDLVTELSRTQLIYLLNTYCSEHFAGGEFKLKHDEKRGHHISYGYRSFAEMVIYSADNNWAGDNEVSEFIIEYATARPIGLTLNDLNETNSENYVCKGYFRQNKLIFQGYIHFEGGASIFSIVGYIQKIIEMSQSLSLHLAVSNAA